RLDNPDDFVAIEIAAALARDIRVIPVMVDGASMPKASKLPDPIKALVRRQAIEVRHTQFGRDAEALIAKVREALNVGSVGLRPWRRIAVAGTAAVATVALLIVGIGGADISGWVPWTVQPETQDSNAANTEAEAESKRKAAEAEQQR